MPFFIDDGYTLSGETTGKGDSGEPFPVVKFKYRPPLSTEMANYRFALKAAQSGDAIMAAHVAFLLARLVEWDVAFKGKAVAPISGDVLAKLPDPILLDLVNECGKWKPRQEGDALGN